MPPLPPPYLNLPPNLTPLQQRSAIATPGVGAGGGLFRSDESFDFYSNLLSNQLVDAQGNVANENLRESLLPIERQFITQKLGFEPTSTTDLLSALGIDTSQPVTQEQVNNAFRNTFGPTRREEFGEGGDRSPGGPQTGQGRVAALSSPTMGEVAGIGALGQLGAGVAPALGAIVGGPVAAGAGALAGLGALGDFGVVGGPNRPQVGTQAFRDVVGMGREAEGRTADRSFEGPDRSSIGGPRGGFGVGGRSGPDRSGSSGTGGGRADNSRSGQGLGFAHGGLIRGYANGGEIGAEGINMSMAQDPLSRPVQDPTFMPPPQGAGMDDVSITAQTGEYVMNRPSVEMFGPEFFDILNDMAMKNPGLEPKEVLKAASTMIPKSETTTNKAQPGDIANRISSAVGQGSFASGGLIGSSPPRL